MPFDAICIDLPVLIKARADGDRRLIEVEASCEEIDSEGDLILQQALLGSADSFVKSGHLDIDHLSEIGHQLGIDNPAHYIIGVPTEVKDLGGGRTSVVGELHKAGRPKADEVWSSLMADPPVRWRASIYGYPKSGGVTDCRVTKSAEYPRVQRFLVQSLDWRSLALTLNPINQSLTGTAHVVTAKSFVAIMKSRNPLLAKAMDAVPVGAPQPANYILPPRNREEIMGHLHHHMRRGNCPFIEKGTSNSIEGFRNHFTYCCGEPEWEADLKALALMHLLKRESR